MNMYVDDGSYTPVAPLKWSWICGKVKDCKFNEAHNASDKSSSLTYTTYQDYVCPSCGSVYMSFSGGGGSPIVHGSCSECGTKYEFPDYESYKLFCDIGCRKALEGNLSVESCKEAGMGDWVIEPKE